MAKIISFHAFRRGSGTSSLISSMAALMALRGKRVGVMDINLQSPSVHIIFGMNGVDFKWTLNDYLWGKCSMEETVYDVTSHLNHEIEGKVFLVPSSSNILNIMRILHEGYDVEKLNQGFSTMIQAFELDYLLVDNGAGISGETLVALANSDIVIVIMRLDQQDYQGTAVSYSLAQKMNIPSIIFLVNDVPASFDLGKTRREVEQTYGCKIGAVLHHSDEMMTLASGGIFSLEYPHHPLTKSLDYLLPDLMD